MDDEALVGIGLVVVGQVEQAIPTLDDALQRFSDLSDLPLGRVAAVRDALGFLDEVLEGVGSGGHWRTFSLRWFGGEYRELEARHTR